MRWGSGSLQEIDHLPFVSPLVKSAETVKEPGQIARDDRGGARPGARRRRAGRPSSTTRSTSSSARPRSEIPALAAGAAGRAGRRASRRRRRCWPAPSGRRSWPAPASTGATARGSCGRWPRRSASRSSSTASAAAACPPTTSSPSAAPAGTALKGADVALVVGVPMDFRLGFGGSFGEETKIVRLDVAPERADRQPRARGRPGRRRRARRLAAIARGGGAARRGAAAPGSSSCAAVEAEKRAAEQEELNDPRSPLHPVRVYRELGEVLDRDAIVVGDGGDFVSYAGRFIETYEPGCWMDPGPVRLPRRRAGPGDRRQGRPSGPPGLPAARRRRLRLRRAWSSTRWRVTASASSG